MNPRFKSLLIGLALAAGATSAVAEGRVEFILDGSGSMWGEAGGEPKVEAAKRVMKDLLQRIELPAGTKIGLTLYGHRRKGDCADIERLAPVDYAARESLGAAIDGLRPKGKTPIADSISIVAESLKGQEGKTSIILVSDGIESCGKEPCAVAKTVRETYGIEVTIHVVGFDVREGQDQLQCIAKAGGGLYRAAANAADLAKEMGEIGTAVQTAAEPQVITWAASPLSAIVVTPLTLDGFPEIETIGIRVAGKRCERGWGSQVARVKQAGEKTLVAPGTYDIVVDTAGTTKTTKLAAQLEVKPKQTVTVHSDMAIAAVKVPEMEGIEHKGVYVLRPGSRRDTFAAVIHGGHENGAKESGAVIPVEPDCLYDVFLDTGQDALLPLAEGVMAKRGGLMVIQ